MIQVYEPYYEPSSELLLITAKQLFLDRERGVAGLGEAQFAVPSLMIHHADASEVSHVPRTFLTHLLYYSRPRVE